MVCVGGICRLWLLGIVLLIESQNRTFLYNKKTNKQTNTTNSTSIELFFFANSSFLHEQKLKKKKKDLGYMNEKNVEKYKICRRMKLFF